MSESSIFFQITFRIQDSTVKVITEDRAYSPESTRTISVFYVKLRLGKELKHALANGIITPTGTTSNAFIQFIFLYVPCSFPYTSLKKKKHSSKVAPFCFKCDSGMIVHEGMSQFNLCLSCKKWLPVKSETRLSGRLSAVYMHALRMGASS